MGPKKTRVKKNQIADPSLGSRVETQAPQTDPDSTVTGIVSDAPNGAPPVPTSTATATREKVIVTLDANGGLDLGSMREKTKERLVAAIRASQDGLFPSVPSAPIKRWPEFAVRGLYGVLGAAETAAAARKYPMEIAAAVFMYNDQEMAVLMEPTQAVLSKYTGKMDRWQEEIALGLVLVQVHFAKLHTLKGIMVEHEARKAASTPAPAPGPAPEDNKTPPIPEGIQ